MTIEFTIPGDPVPKAKLTRGQQWTEKAQNYAGYKKHVQQCIQPALIALAVDLREQDKKKLQKGERYLKPISINQKMGMSLFIHFRDEQHGDPENIFGTIADALFVQDKHLAITGVDFDHDASKVGVEVKIEIPNTL